MWFAKLISFLKHLETVYITDDMILDWGKDNCVWN